MKGKYPEILNHPRHGEQARSLYNDAQKLLVNIVSNKKFTLSATYKIFNASSENEIVKLFDGDLKNPKAKIFFLRQQESKTPSEDPHYLSLADFIAPSNSNSAPQDHIGAFVVSSGFEAFTWAKELEKSGDDYSAILVKSLADRFAEALAEFIHQKMRFELATENPASPLSPTELLQERYSGIRPAPGYAACPDHSDKGLIWSLLNVEQNLNLKLTENFAMDPPGTVAAWVIPNPKAHYFSVGRIGVDQFKNYIQFKNWTPETGKKWIK